MNKTVKTAILAAVIIIAAAIAVQSYIGTNQDRTGMLSQIEPAAGQAAVVETSPAYDVYENYDATESMGEAIEGVIGDAADALVAPIENTVDPMVENEPLIGEDGIEIWEDESDEGDLPVDYFDDEAFESKEDPTRHEH